MAGVEKKLTLGVLFKGDTTSLESAVGKLKTSLNGLNKGLGATNTSLGKTTTSMGGVGSASGKASAATKKFGGDITFLGKQIGTIDGFYNRLMGAFKVTTSYGIAATAIYSVINAMKTGAQAIVDYDQGLKNLQAITGATDYEVSAMGETIKQVARDTKFSTTEVSDGMTLLGQAGFSAGEAMTAMRDTAFLATGTLSNMQTSTDLVSTSIRAFGISASESGRVVDIMANAVNKSKLTIDKLRTAFNYVAATASQAGLSLEETAGTMMTLANNGLRASTIGTGLRQVLSRTIKPSEKMASALAAVGLELNDINPAMVGWQGTLRALTAVLFDSNTNTVNMAKAFSLFGLRGAQAAAVIVKSFVAGDYAKAMKNVYEIGTAENMAAIQAEGLAVKLKNLADRAKNIAVAFGEAGASGIMRTFLDALRGVASGLESFVNSTVGKVVVQLAAITGSFKLATMAATAFFSLMMKSTVIQATVMTFRGLATTLSGKTGLAGAFATVGGYFTAFLARLGPVGIAIGLVTAALLAYRAALENSVKSAETTAVKNMQIVDSLRAFQGAMVATIEKTVKLKNDTALARSANEAYIATLNRLIKAHPELAGKIKLTVDAIEENNRVVKEFADAAHLRNVQALVDLYNEYGKAADRAKVWVGVWEDIKRGLIDLQNVFTSFFDMVATGVEMSVRGWGLIGIEIGKTTGSAEKSWFDFWRPYFTWMGEHLLTLKDQWRDFWLELGNGSDKAAEFTQKQQDVIAALAQEYVGLGDKATMSFGAIKRELEATTKDGKQRSNEMVAAIIDAVARGREAAKIAMDDVRNHNAVTANAMTATWKAYQDTLSTQERFGVQQAWEGLQKKAKDYSDFLLKELEAKRVSEEQLLSLMEEWWGKELQGYIAKQAKEEESLNKSLEKQQAAHEKSAETVKGIEEKMADDRRAIRQTYMTEEQKLNDDLIEARAAQAKAEIMLAQATTQEELDAALIQVEVARKKYSDILKVALDAKNQQTKANEVVTASEAQVVNSTYDAWMNWYASMGKQITMYTSTYTTESKKKADIAKSTADKVVAENEKANKSMDDLMHQALDRIGKTGKGITTEFDNMKTKAAEPKPINVVEEPAKTVIRTVKEGLTEVGTQAAKDKPVNVSTTAAVSNIQRAIDKIKDLIDWIGKIPREVNVNVNVTSTGTGAGGGGSGTETSLSEGLSSATSQIEAFAATVGASSGDSSGSSSGAVMNVGFTGSGSTTKPLSEKIKEAVGWIKGLRDRAAEGAKMVVGFFGQGSDEKPLSEKIDELGSNLSEFGDDAASIMDETDSRMTQSGLSITETAAETSSSIADSFTNAINAILRKIDELLAKMSVLTEKDYGIEIITTYTLVGRQITAYDVKTGQQLWTRFEPGMSEGGKLSGYGGGDTVPAMLEKGEFVIRKEAVQKYGAGLFAGLNSMVAGMKIGGPVVRPAMPVIANQSAAQRFSQGGQVSQASRPGNTINITLSPTFMTGDRNSVRQAATMLRDEIKNIDHRYGVN